MHTVFTVSTTNKVFYSLYSTFSSKVFAPQNTSSTTDVWNVFGLFSEMECDAMEDLQAASQSVIVKLVLIELIPEGRCATTVEKS